MKPFNLEDLKRVKDQLDALPVPTTNRTFGIEGITVSNDPVVVKKIIKEIGIRQYKKNLKYLKEKYNL